MVIGSASYVGMNVRVWYMCSGSVLYMLAFMGEKASCWRGTFEKFSTLDIYIYLIGQALFYGVTIGPCRLMQV